MTPLTLSGACFRIIVPDTLQQQTAECHLVRCHIKWLSSYLPGAVTKNQDNQVKWKKWSRSHLLNKSLWGQVKTANKKQREARCLSVFLELTLNGCNEIQSRSAFGSHSMYASLTILCVIKKHSVFLHCIIYWGDAYIFFLSLMLGGSSLCMSRKTMDRGIHGLTSTWNKCGFLTNHLPLPKPTFRPVGGMESIPWVSFLLAVWMRLWVKGVALCDWWAMTN